MTCNVRTLQVRIIRHILRKEGHKNVVVDPIRNVQGREFRIIIISCVRTRDALTSKENGEESRYTIFSF